MTSGRAFRDERLLPFERTSVGFAPRRRPDPRTIGAPHCPVGDDPNVDILLIGVAEMRVRLAGPFVTDHLAPAAERLRMISNLGFDHLEVDATDISTVDASGRLVLDDFLRRVAASGTRLEAFDPGHYLAVTTAA